MRDIAFTLFIFGMIPYILMRPYVGLLIWSWITYMNPHRLCYGFVVTFPWVELVAIVTLVSVVLSRERKSLTMSPMVVLLFVFFLWTTVTTFFALQPVSAWQEWEDFGKNLIMVLVTLMLVTDRRRLHWLVWAIAVSIGFWGLKGGVFTILHGGNYHVYGPTRSFMQNNNDLAAVLCMILPLLRYLQLQASQKYMRTGLGFAMFFTGVAVLGTYSRGGLIALAAVAAILFLKSRRRIGIILVVVVLGVGGYHFMPSAWKARMGTLHHADQTQSAQTRIQSWEFASNVAFHRPLIGGGFNVYENAATWQRYAPQGAIERAVHSIYFRVLGEQGFPGLALFLALLFVSWRNCARVRRWTRGSPQNRWAFDLASMLQVTLIAYMVAEAAGTLSYFDLSYQLMAMCALIPSVLANQAAKSNIQGHAAAASSRISSRENIGYAEGSGG